MASDLEAKIVGDGIEPAALRAADLAIILHRLHAAVLAASGAQRPADKPVNALALTGIDAGSCKLTFSVPPYAQDGARKVKAFIGNPALRSLPASAQRPLYELSQFFSKRDWTAEFRGFGRGVAVLSPQNPIPAPRPARSRGGSLLIGKCIEVGGVRPHMAIAPLAGGRLVPVTVSAELARELGGLLYEVVALEGEAVWDTATGAVVKFTASRISPYRPGRAAAGARELAAVGPRWADVDPVAYGRGEAD